MATTKVNATSELKTRNQMSLSDFKESQGITSLTLESWTKADGTERFSFLADGTWIAGSAKAIELANNGCPIDELQYVELSKDGGKEWFSLITTTSKAQAHHSVRIF